jgi:hypothetical protein
VVQAEKEYAMKCFISTTLLSLAVVSQVVDAQEIADYKYSTKYASAGFDSHNLRNAEFTYSVISDARFQGCDLRNADLRYCVASDADFSRADLRGAKLRYSVLSDARFDGARLEGADLNHCVFTSSTKFTPETTYDSSTRFPRGFDPEEAGLKLVQVAAQPSEDPTQRTFKAVLHSSNSGLPSGALYGDFTLGGPVTKSLVALPGSIGEVVGDPSGRSLFGMGGHGLYKIDLAKRAAIRVVEKNVPRISWAMGMTYDTKRDRVLLATLGGEGFIYSYRPHDDAWSIVASLNNVDVTAIAYHEPLDRIFGIAEDRQTGRSVLYEYEGADATFIRSRPLDMPIVGSFIDRALQLMVVEKSLVFIQVPTSAKKAEPVIHVIDPKTADARLAVE